MSMKFFIPFFIIISAFLSAKNAPKKIQNEHVIIRAHDPKYHGLFSCCDLVLSHLFLYDNRCLDKHIIGMSVDFGTTGLYYSPKYGANWWDYYFEPLEVGKRKGVPSRVSTRFENDTAWTARQKYKVTRQEAYRIINKYIKVKKPIQDKVKNFVKNHFSGHFVIGVHYRGTDKVRNNQIRRVSLDEIVMLINSQIAKINNQPYKIFVATDEAHFLKAIKDIYGDKLLSLDAFRSKDGTPVHHLHEDRYLLGEQAIIDSILLSKCHYLIRTSSNLSIWSTFLNPDLPTILLSQSKKGE